MPKPCQIAVEGSRVKLFQSSHGGPEGREGVLFVLVPVLKNLLDKNAFDAERLMAELTVAFGTSRQAYDLKRVQHKRSSTKTFMIQYFQKVSTATQSLSCTWRPSISWAYVVRASGTVEVYSADGGQEFVEELSAFNTLFADRVVIPEAISAPQGLVVN